MVNIISGWSRGRQEEGTGERMREGDKEEGIGNKSLININLLLFYINGKNNLLQESFHLQGYANALT